MELQHAYPNDGFNLAKYIQYLKNRSISKEIWKKKSQDQK